uniref:Uncharacterized protein n=1 Tax=Anguilla anguilla TaxID=7936 RepID=A0A0E9T8G4_ANGAN
MTTTVIIGSVLEYTVSSTAVSTLGLQLLIKACRNLIPVPEDFS